MMDDSETRKKLKELKDWYEYYMNRFFKRQGNKYREKVRDHHDQIADLLKYGSATVVAEFIRENPKFKPRPKPEIEEHEPSRDKILKEKYQPLSRSVYDPNIEATRKLKPNPDFVYEPSELVETGDMLKQNKSSETEVLLKQMEQKQLDDAVKRLSTDTPYADSVTKVVARDLKNKDPFKDIPILKVSKHLKPDEMVLIPLDCDLDKAVLIKGVNNRPEDIELKLNEEQKQIKDTVDKKESKDVWKGLFLNRGKDE